MKIWKFTLFKGFKPCASAFCFLFPFCLFAEDYKDLEVLSHVFHIVEKRHLKPLKSETLTYKAIRGMLRELDPYSYFFTPEQLRKFGDLIRGNRYNLGLEIEKTEKGLIISAIAADSPAALKGLKPGDRLISLDGRPVKHISLESVLLKLKDSKIRTLKVSRGESGRIFTARIRPVKSKVKTVQFQPLKNDRLYARIFRFTGATFAQLNKGLKKHSSQKGLLLDLRGNPGGNFNQAIKTADLFINEGTLVYMHIRGSERNKPFAAQKSNTLPDMPLAVLINEFSASGSEIAAGALKHHCRALLIGRKTFGKSVIQETFVLKHNYGLNLTVGQYFTPDMKTIHGRGVTPHVVIEKSDKSGAPFSSILQDPEVLQALEYLNNFETKAKPFLQCRPLEKQAQPV